MVSRQEAHQRREQQRRVEGLAAVVLVSTPRSSTPLAKMSSLISCAASSHSAALPSSPVIRAILAPRSTATQHMILEEVKCWS